MPMFSVNPSYIQPLTKKPPTKNLTTSYQLATPKTNASSAASRRSCYVEVLRPLDIPGVTQKPADKKFP
jgi:hypothetical protein